MVLEDLNAYKNSENNSTKLYDALIDNRTGTGMAFWEQEGAEGCAPNPGIQAPVNNAETNIRNIWDTRFSQRRLNCNPAVVNSQRLNTYTICRDNTECSNQNNDILMVSLYIQPRPRWMQVVARPARPAGRPDGPAGQTGQKLDRTGQFFVTESVKILIGRKRWATTCLHRGPSH